MELSQLEYFKIASRHRSFTQAAEELHITQPALSISMSKLEKELGAALFDRNVNSLQLTSAGRAFLVWCNQALTALDSGVREVRDIRGTGGGNVCVAVSEAIFIKHLVRDFLHSHENASLQCYLLTHDQMRTALSEGTVDFVISRGALHGPDIFWTPVYKDCLTALMTTQNPLAKRPKIRMEDLADEFFLMGDLVYEMKSFVYDLCYSAGFSPKIRYEGHESDVASMLRALEHTVMLTYNSTTFGVQADIGDVEDVTAVPIEDAKLEPVGMGLRTNRYQSAAVQDFFEMVHEYFLSLPEGPR